MEVEPATGYYPTPNSLLGLPAYLRTGLIVIGCLACISIVTTTSVLASIVHQYIVWSRHAEKTNSYNQCVILLFNLLVADLIQALSFSLSFHWVAVDGILAPTCYCYAQAGFLNFGNLASGSFVFLIALHTAYSVVTQRTISNKIFVRVIAIHWLTAFLFTIGGPSANGADFFARAGNWCWISEKFTLARLLLHYLWIFIFQISTILIYIGLYIYLRRGSRLATGHSQLAAQNPKLLRAARSMIVYPAVYTIGTLPIAVGRMLMMSGTIPSSRYLIFAGAMLTSCGWADGLLYTVTRNVFRESDGERRRKASDDEPDHSTTHPSTVRAAPWRLTFSQWMTLGSPPSFGAPLHQVNTASALLSPDQRQPSETVSPSPSALLGHVASHKQPSISTLGISFIDFLNDEDDKSGSLEMRELHVIPESPGQHTGVV